MELQDQYLHSETHFLMIRGVKKAIIILSALLSACSAQNFVNPQAAKTDSSIASSQTEWTDYKNDERHISFSYPSEWKIETESDWDSSTFVRLISPDLAKYIEKVKREKLETEVPGGSVRIKFCSSINSHCSLMHGDSYSNLEEFVATPNTGLTKQGELVVGDEKAFKVSEIGYEIAAIILEHEGAIYIFEFPEYSGSFPSDDSPEMKIMSTVKFFK